MPYLDSLDIANRALQHCGAEKINTVDEDSKNNTECAFAYDKLRRPELRRNVWRFAIRRAILRALDTNTLLLNPDLWDADVTYLPGSIVRDANGALWFSSVPENVNNEPRTSTAWDMYFGPMTVHLYDEDITYSAGELVYAEGASAGSYVVYKSLVSSNEDDPETGTAWAATTTYRKNEVVRYSSAQWRSLIDFNLNITPADGPLDWDEGATYVISDTITGSDGFIYTATGTTTGDDPVSDGGVNWTKGAANAWDKTPTLHQSSIKWLPIFAEAKRMVFDWPIGSGPAANSSSRCVYRLPAGFLREAPQLPKPGYGSLGGPVGLDANDWELEGDYIVTAEVGPIPLRFVADIIDVRVMDDMFCEGLAARIALAVVEPLTQSGSKKTQIAAEYQKWMTEARLVNAIEVGAVEPPEDEYISVRR